jgi:hypothetical protein
MCFSLLEGEEPLLGKIPWRVLVNDRSAEREQEYCFSVTPWKVSLHQAVEEVSSIKSIITFQGYTIGF